MIANSAGSLPRYQLSGSNRQARELVNYINTGQMWLDAPYQRGLVWTADQQRGLVKSWLLGLPIPSVIYNDRNTEGWGKPTGMTTAMSSSTASSV